MNSCLTGFIILDPCDIKTQRAVYIVFAMRETCYSAFSLPRLPILINYFILVVCSH